MGCIRIQLLNDGNWHKRYTIEIDSGYNKSSADWTLLNLDFSGTNYGINLICDQFDNPICDECFSNVIITYSVY